VKGVMIPTDASILSESNPQYMIYATNEWKSTQFCRLYGNIVVLHTMHFVAQQSARACTLSSLLIGSKYSPVMMMWGFVGRQPEQ